MLKIIIVLIFLVSILVIVGNVLVIMVFLMKVFFRISINYFIVNMVVFDLFFVLIIWFLYVFEGMFLGKSFIEGFMVMFVCKLEMYFRVVL